jgi:hypothetical protein
MNHAGLKNPTVSVQNQAQLSYIKLHVKKDNYRLAFLIIYFRLIRNYLA